MQRLEERLVFSLSTLLSDQRLSKTKGELHASDCGALLRIRRSINSGSHSFGSVANSSQSCAK
jgi:hypothetical protein